MDISGRRHVAVATCAMLLLTACGTTEPPSVQRVDQPNLTPVAAAPATARVVAAGDIACKPGSRVRARKCRHAATARLAARLNPHLVLPLGDTQYERGTLRQYRRSYARTWGKLLSRTRPTVGNHEYRTRGARGYYTYFRNRQPGPPGYYRTAAGSWAVYVLNSNCGKVNCGAQAAWLDRQMTARPVRCTLVTMHHPRFSSGSEGSSPFVKPFWDVAHKHGAELALSGHNHMYERFQPMDGAGRIQPRGIQGFVVGTGGKSLFRLGTRKAGSVFLQNRAHGVLVLDLRADSYTWTFKAINGRTLDTGTRSCS